MTKKGRGAPAYGWTVRDGRLVKNPREQEVLARIRRLHMLGLGAYQIASNLNDADIRPRRGGRWHAVTVARVLDKRAYRAPRRRTR